MNGAVVFAIVLVVVQLVAFIASGLVIVLNDDAKEIE